MARPKKETDLKAQTLKRYDELVAKRKMIDWEIKAIEKYLKATGVVKATSGRSGKAVGPKKKTSATDAILSAIGRSKQGISIEQIMKQTGHGRQTVNGVLARMKKEGKVKAAKRGIYVTA